MNNAITPLMAQYRRIKNDYDDCILFFRVGDFYETFYEDAVEVSSILNIALTTRDKKKDNPIPLAGVPFHAAESYISRLLMAGKKVAICEQVEDPAKAQGLVKRQVVEVLTPGTAMHPQILEEHEHNYCLSLFFEKQRAGVAIVDVSTGDFYCGEDDLYHLHYLLQGKNIKEIICNLEEIPGDLSVFIEALGNPVLSIRSRTSFDGASVEGALRLQFAMRRPEVIENLGHLGRIAAGALLDHCQTLKGGVLHQITNVKKFEPIGYLAMDDETIGNLELFRPLSGFDTKATLISVIDHTITAMGGRLIRDWLQKPLARVELIDARLEAVEEIYQDRELQEEIGRILKGISDIQRLAARIVARKAMPSELISLKSSLQKVPEVKEALSKRQSYLIRELICRLEDHKDIVDKIDSAIVSDPPLHLREGGVIKRGYSRDLDDLIRLNEDAKNWIADLERRERKRTGIGSLKVGYNKIFGYFIEVSKTHKKKVPEDYLTKQTLVNSQRYYTEELKEREVQILETEAKRVECEQRIFEELCLDVAHEIPSIQKTSESIAALDALRSLVIIALKHGYTKPVVGNSRILDISRGRHPVLERVLKDTFIPNDIRLDQDKRQFALITGPNMSGKSTFLRQIALIVILAQMGSFVPAERAIIGIVDKIFTRVGATDRLSRGQSTFLVEMDETARILKEMTDRSLILLDEVGRGTSTFDGLSIAWAMTEYILQGVKARPRTLFATHFHELTQLRNTYPRLVNLKITIKEWERGIIFLRKVVPGTSERSYGIHAAKIAGLPPEILTRAEEILEALELRRDLLARGVELARKDLGQYNMFSQSMNNQDNSLMNNSNLLSTIRNLLKDYDVNSSTPLEALQFIKKLKDVIRNELR